jgi:hypothetical protein
MKTNELNEGRKDTSVGVAFSKACLNGCRKILAQIRNAREMLLAEARETLEGQDKLLRLAVNEAEALAWQTRYPQLLFPTLAVEKIRGVAAWNNRQRLVS